MLGGMVTVDPRGEILLNMCCMEIHRERELAHATVRVHHTELFVKVLVLRNKKSKADDKEQAKNGRCDAERPAEAEHSA